MSFKLWSQTNPEANSILKPDLGLRNWDELSLDEKKRVWIYLDSYFFEPNTEKKVFSLESNNYFTSCNFNGEDQEAKRKRINFSIQTMNELYKVNNYTKAFLNKYTHYAACEDFYSIFLYQAGHVVLELLSLYCKAILTEYHHVDSRQQGESAAEFKKRNDAIKWKDFDDFAKTVNEVFGDFGINVHLTRSGFVPKQEDKITKNIYEPVLKVLGNIKWKEVNSILGDAFMEYRKNTETGFSNCVTNTVTAVQAFLQIVVNGQTGSGDIAKLIAQAQTKGLIPRDSFSREIFKKIEATLSIERQETGIAHPKKEYATDRNALLVLNLAMIFFNHCIVYDSN